MIEDRDLTEILAASRENPDWALRLAAAVLEEAGFHDVATKIALLRLVRSQSDRLLHGDGD